MAIGAAYQALSGKNTELNMRNVPTSLGWTQMESTTLVTILTILAEQVPGGEVATYP
jgi:hypothetical protein